MNWEYREHQASLLAGDGIEIGALNHPLPLPARAKVQYVDVLGPEEAANLFPELSGGEFVAPTYRLDLDRDGLSGIADQSQDFVVCSHVIEHLANPLGAVGEIFRVLRPGGLALIAIPDMRYTFDRHRQETTLWHVYCDFLDGVSESSDEHYLEFLRSAGPHVFAEPEGNLPVHVERARSRREHAHAWTSEGFRDLLLVGLPLIGHHGLPVIESLANQNELEYCAVWRKQRRG